MTRDPDSLEPVGFWRDESDESTWDYPDPHALVSRRWSRQERKAVAAYLKTGEVVRHWRGYPTCRFRWCFTPRAMLGDADLTDGVYLWPQGFAHYVTRHRVKPPERFLEHIRAQLSRLGDGDSGD